MKFHFKTFAMSLLLAGIMLGIAAGGYSIYYMASMSHAKTDKTVAVGYTTHVDDASKTPLERLVDHSDRVNFLVYGTDGGRSDTIMLLSYDVKNKIADLISVPRDTYVDYNSSNPQWQKINSVIERKEGGGPQGLKETVSNLLKVPIAYYVEVHYSGVKNIVNTVGGVELDVPVKMNYDDNYCKPPLHIHLNAGRQTLDGDKAIQFLRWRKNNGQGGAGDLPRTQRQQAFIKALAEKSFSLKLPSVIEAAYGAIETDMDLNKMLFFGTTVTGFDMSELRSHRLPGENRSSKYFFYSSEAGIEKLMLKIYSRTPGQPDDHDSDIINENGLVLESISGGTLTQHQYNTENLSTPEKTTTTSIDAEKPKKKKRKRVKSVETSPEITTPLPSNPAENTSSGEIPSDSAEPEATKDLPAKKTDPSSDLSTEPIDPSIDPAASSN